jgi:hypothetical protein
MQVAELRRVGCSRGINDGNWNDGAQRSLRLFNENAKTNFDAQLASLDALHAVRSRKGRVCPLICERGGHSIEAPMAACSSLATVGRTGLRWWRHGGDMAKSKKAAPRTAF